MGLQFLSGLDAYRHRNDDRRLRNRQLDAQQRIFDYNFDRQQKQDERQDAEQQRWADRGAEQAKWRLTRDPQNPSRWYYQNTETGEIRQTRPVAAKQGGLAQCACGGHMAKGGKPSRPVSGPGTGQSDEIPAMLSDGEYVIDASTVSDLGDGSTEAGARKLDGMVQKIRQQKRGGLSQLPPKAKRPEQYLKKGK